MTVQSNDIRCPTQQVASAKSAGNVQASRDANGERKSRGFGKDQKPPTSGADSESDSLKTEQQHTLNLGHRSRGADLERKSRGTDRKSKCLETERISHDSDIVDSDHKDMKSEHAQLKVPDSGEVRRTHGSVSAVEFFSSGGSEPEMECESEGVSFLSAPETMPPKKPCRDTRNKLRFKKFFRPLRRSKSIGNAKETSSSSSSTSSSASSSASSSSASSSSAFSFLHKKENDGSEDRQSVDTGRGSMEPQSDREIEEDEAKEREALNKDRKKKSITTEMKEKLHGLRRRYADLTTNQKDGKTEKPSVETIKNWSKTIEFLLADKFGLQCFHAFLKSEFSEENIDFWMSCEAFKNLKPSKQPLQAQKIFAEYVTHQAPREINIDSVTRELTYSRMVQPDSTTFDAAQKRVQALMDKDSYPRFIQSSLYQELVSGCSPLLVS